MQVNVKLDGALVTRSGQAFSNQTDAQQCEQMLSSIHRLYCTGRVEDSSPFAGNGKKCRGTSPSSFFEARKAISGVWLRPLPIHLIRHRSLDRAPCLLQIGFAVLPDGYY